jgi:hypothetical protein
MQTDNARKEQKLDLRRHFLRRYQDDGGPRVLDCCQGSRVLWTALEREFALTSYLGVDLKPRRGRLRVDSARILAQGGWRHNVIDVDPYGSPWKHWDHILRARHAMTVFLTIGFVPIGGGALGRIEREALGLSGVDVPAGMNAELQAMSLPYCLSAACGRIVEAVEAYPSGPHARYIGVRLQPLD